MDKAQARILTLVLIAVLFIGQALYDFIKKNRSRSVNRPRHSISKSNHKARPLNRQSPQKPTRSAAAPMAKVVAERSRLESELYPSLQSEPTAGEEMMVTASESSTTQNRTLPERDDLRRAVIWSEILKRKF